MSVTTQDGEFAAVPSDPTKKSQRGFASMDPELKREIASKGGRTAHALGRAHEFNSQEGREAGRKGGLVISQDRAHMSEIGKRGAASRVAKKLKLNKPE